MADADPTEFDWVAFVGAWVITWPPVLFLPTPLALLIAFSALFAWMAWRRQRAALVAG